MFGVKVVFDAIAATYFAYIYATRTKHMLPPIPRHAFAVDILSPSRHVAGDIYTSRYGETIA